MKKIIIIILTIFLFCGCSLSNGRGENNQNSEDNTLIKEIKIYDSDCFIPDDNLDDTIDDEYDRLYNEPLVITDEKTISKLVELGGDKSKYEEWTQAGYEGFNEYWIDYGDGFIVGIYDDVDYCMFCEEPGQLNGGPYYKAPAGLRKLVDKLLD